MKELKNQPLELKAGIPQQVHFDASQPEDIHFEIRINFENYKSFRITATAGTHATNNGGPILIQSNNTEFQILPGEDFPIEYYSMLTLTSPIDTNIQIIVKNSQGATFIKM